MVYRKFPNCFALVALEVNMLLVASMIPSACRFTEGRERTNALLPFQACPTVCSLCFADTTGDIEWKATANAPLIPIDGMSHVSWPRWQ